MNRLIFGCGYLGKRIATKWLEDGDQVYAVTRSSQRADQLRSLNLLPIVGDVTRPDTLEELPEADTVVFAVGMDRTRYSDIRQVYVEGLRHVLAAISPEISHLIYVSSTGVYGDFGGSWIDESAPTEPLRDGGKACLEAEQLIANSKFAKRSTILRFAGIYGPGRVPTRSVIESKQWKKLSSQGFLNLIHVDDGASLIRTVANEPPEGQTYLVSDGRPPLRSDYYELIARHFGMDEIPWGDSTSTPQSRSGSNKRVSNQKLLQRYSMEFAYPDFESGLAQALDAGEQP